jgi:hypothetical protein
MGCDYILYAPSNNDVSAQKESRDAWGWENLLWLGMGQKIRKDEWDPTTTEPLAPSIQEMLDYAADKEIRLVAYVYPTLGQPYPRNELDVQYAGFLPHRSGARIYRSPDPA